MFTDFMSKKFNIWESFYKKEIIGFDDKTKQPESYPPPFNADKASWDAWKAKVSDPITGEFYKGKETQTEYDDNGIEKSKKTIDIEPTFQRNQIIRIRTRDGNEYLYSRGMATGFTQLGNRETTNFQEPELWTETRFKREQRFMPKENRYREIAIGPTGKEIIHYTLPYTPENVDKLMEDAAPNCRFILIEEGNRTPSECPNLQIFKTKPFDYIKNADYLSPTEKERIAKESKQLVEKTIEENKRSLRA